MTSTQDMSRVTNDATKPGFTVRELGWGVYVPLAAVIGLVCWIYLPVFRWWYNAWMAEESSYSHGILVPIISAFIIWLKRKTIAGTPIRPSAWGYAVLVPAVLVILFSAFADSVSVRGLVFPIVLGGLVLLLLGPDMLKTLSFPICYLYFMCVLPGHLLAPVSFRIQMLSTTGATAILNVVGFHATQAGQMIMMQNVDAQVAEACSGFRLLISLFAFSVLFAYLKDGPLWGRITLVAITLPLSLVANSLRIALVCAVGEFRGTDAMHAFHDYSGYLVLLLAFIILPQIARLVKCRNFNSILSS